MSDSPSIAQPAATTEVESQHHDIHPIETNTPRRQPPQPTPEQLYQYHLFTNSQTPYSPPSSPHPSKSSDTSSSQASTSAVVETVIAIVGMILMLVVAVLGYQQMRDGIQHDRIPDMSGVIVALACIPIAVAFFTLLMKLAIRRSRQMEAREGQIALVDDVDLERGALLGRAWGGGHVSVRADDGEEEAPPAYEERATQTARS